MPYDGRVRGIPLGPYILVKRLARGGMAEIYLARKHGPEGFSRDLVVKRMLPHLSADPEFRALFREEARIVAQLGHPNIVHVYDFGEDDHNSYLVMELVRGVDLRALTTRSHAEAFAAHRQGAVPPHHAAKILSFVCEGLAHAHSLTDAGRRVGLVHRDITPSNVLVSFEGAVKVVDFGVAKLQRRSRREATQVGMVRGKHPYLSPEQARGEPLDARSDLFNVGILLYETCTGDPLFPHHDPAQSRLMAASGRIPDPGRLRQLPGALEAIAQQCLAPRRDDRYADALALRSDLEGFLRTVAEPSDSVELGRFVRRLFADVLQEDQRAPRAAGTVTVAASPGTAPMTGAGEVAADELDEPTPPLGEIYNQGPVTVRPRHPRLGAPLVSPPASAPAARDLQPTSSDPPATPPSKSRRARVPLAVLVVTLCAAGLWWMSRPEPEPEPEVSEIAVIAPQPARLRVHTDPSGLQVAIDGEPQGFAPVLVEVDPGEHRVEVLHEGRTVAERQLEVAEGGAQTIVLRASVPGWVRIRSEPEGARVTVASETLGLTPLEVQLAPGMHVVVLELDGFETHEEPVEVGPAAEATLSILLRELSEDEVATAQPRPSPSMTPRARSSGFLSVMTVPWCNVFIGERRLGTTPIFRQVLPVGRHTVTLRSPNRAPKRTVVTVRANEETRIRETL